MGKFDARVELRSLHDMLESRFGSSKAFVSHLKEEFQRADEDGNHELDEEEFVSCLMKISSECDRPFEKDVLEKVFCYLDAGNDGTISTSEFFHAMRAIPAPKIVDDVDAHPRYQRHSTKLFEDPVQSNVHPGLMETIQSDAHPGVFGINYNNSTELWV